MAAGRHAMHSGGALPGAEASMVSGGHSGACPSGPPTNMVRTSPQVMAGAQQRMPSPEVLCWGLSGEMAGVFMYFSVLGN